MRTRQLNRKVKYSETSINGDQIFTLASIGIINSLPYQSLQKYPPLSETTAPLEERFKAYVDVNCNSCHQPGAGATTIDFRFSTALSNMNILNVTADNDLGIIGAKRVLPKAVDKSVVYQRMLRTDSVRMPPLGSSLADPAALDVLRTWINSL